MATLALTDLLCRNAKAPDTGRVELADAKCPGLVLRVTAAGAKSWAVRYRDAGGRSQRLTIGAYPTIGLADARARAAEVRRAAVSGANPAAEKRDARENAETRTVDHLAARYLREHTARFKRPRPIAEDERNLRLHVLPKWGRRPFADIKRRA